MQAAFMNNAAKQIANGYFGAKTETERVMSGHSTYVYRVRHKGRTYYLRILPEDGSFAPEAKTHALMLAAGVRVPEVLFWEHKNKLADRSVMLTTEIPGECLEDSKSGGEIPMGVLREAGRQLAQLNAIPVDGFGWVDRRWPEGGPTGSPNSGDTVLKGENRHFRDYYYASLYADIDALAAFGFDAEKLKDLMDRAFVRLEADVKSNTAFLAHGDFDHSHIFQTAEGYAGMIDFGEIRGSHRLYDLGHYRLHESDAHFSLLAAGYHEIHALMAKDYTAIDELALFVGIGRSKHAHYRNLLRRMMERMGENVCVTV